MAEKWIIAPDPFPWLDYSRYAFSMGVEKGGVLFLSGQSASQYDPSLGRVVCKGDVVEQARLVYQKLGRVLEAAGASFDNVVKTVDYLTPQGLAGYRSTAEVRREHFKGNWPASTGVVVERLLRADALIEVDALAVLDAKKHAINPGWPRYDNLTYQPGVRAGDLLCLSGFTGSLPPQHTPLLEEQLANIDRSIEAVMQEAGATPGDLVKRVDYVAPNCLEGYRSTAGRGPSWGSPHARTGIVVNRLLRSEPCIEVETAAVLGGRREEIDPPGWSCRHTGPAAVRKGRFLFLSGQGALEHPGDSVAGEGNLIAQATQAYANIRQVVEAAGCTMKDVVKTTEFITAGALESYREVGQLRREIFPGEFPVATGVVVNSLTHPGLLIEVDAVAISD